MISNGSESPKALNRTCLFEQYIPKNDILSNLPDEMLIKIFSCLPYSREALKNVSKKFNVLTNDESLINDHAAIRLNDLKEAFNNVESFSERWTGQMNMVKSRLKALGKALSSKNIYRELIKFQAERFPSIMDKNDPYMVDGYLEREKIIKKWNTYLFAEKAFRNKGLREPKNKNDLEHMISEIKEYDFSRDYSLNLQGIHLTEIPEEVTRYGATLFSIDLSENKIFYIPKNCFSELPNLEFLWLNNNRITTIEHGIFSRNSNLQKLYLYCNQIETIEEGAFSGLTRLDELWLSNNWMIAIDKGMLSSLTSLIVLELGNNRISTIDKEALSDLINLHVLGLKYNRITKIKKEMFSSLRRLQDLRLCNNQISAIKKEGFSGLANLQVLELNDNWISTIDKEAFSGLTSLQRLFLDKDQIRLMDKETCSSLKNMIEITR